MEEIRIECPEIFDFEQCLEYFKRNENEILFSVVDREIYKAVKINNLNILIHVSYVPHYLKVEILNQDLITPLIVEKLISYIEEWFDFSTDLSSFYNDVKDNKILAPLIKELYGLRIIRIPEFFEAITWGIIGQQINLSFAYKLKRRLVEKYGESIPYKGRQYYIHPSPEKISNVTIEELMELKFSRRKAEYLIDIANKIQSQIITKKMLLNLTDKEEIEKALTDLRGIGPWTAHYVMMRSLGIKNAYPVGDVGLQNALKLILQLEKKPSKEFMIELNKDWEKWSSYATFYIWRAPYLRNIK